MKRIKQTWTIEEKENIVLEIQKIGIVEGCRKFGIYPTTYYEWLKKYNEGGKEALKPLYVQRSEKEMRRLEKENEMLKRLLAEKELEDKMREELFKKKMLQWKREKEIITTYIGRGMVVKQACKIAEISRSKYYYRSKGGKGGKRPTSTTMKTNGQIMSNEIVIAEIKQILMDDFIDYGYDKVTKLLQQRGYIINHKKVYRLMKENNLLLPRNRGSGQLRTFVKYTQPCPSYPFEVIEIDIKYVYIHGQKRNAYLITILDTLTRFAPIWTLSYSMKSYQVQLLINELILNYLQPLHMLNRGIEVTIRTDNGSQFIANLFREHIKNNYMIHEFIKPRTPKQNGHIESFHSTVEKLVTSRFEFENLCHAKEIFTKFYQTYNYQRILKVLLYNAPAHFFNLFVEGKINVTYDIKTKKQYFFLREKEDKCPSFPTEDILLAHLNNNNLNWKNEKYYLCKNLLSNNRGFVHNNKNNLILQNGK